MSERGRGPLYKVVQTGAVVSCPACGGRITVVGVLDRNESSRSFVDAAVPCEDCGVPFDVEWEALRTMGGEVSAAVSSPHARNVGGLNELRPLLLDLSAPHRRWSERVLLSVRRTRSDVGSEERRRRHEGLQGGPDDAVSAAQGEHSINRRRKHMSGAKGPNSHPAHRAPLLSG